MEDSESLKKAMTGAYAVFLITNYWETMSADTEKRQGINVANVAKVCLDQFMEPSGPLAHICLGSWRAAPDFQ